MTRTYHDEIEAIKVNQWNCPLNVASYLLLMYKVLFPFILGKIGTFQQVSVAWQEEFNQRQTYNYTQQISLVYATEREKKLTLVSCLRSLLRYRIVGTVRLPETFCWFVWQKIRSGSAIFKVGYSIFNFIWNRHRNFLKFILWVGSSYTYVERKRREKDVTHWMCNLKT
jgi:hypothetical protein